MLNRAIAIYCIICDVLIAVRHREDKRRVVSDAEIITTAIVAALEFGGNHEKARQYMKDTQLIPNMLSESRFCRRLHAVADLTADLFHQLGQVFKDANLSTEYLIDSFPVEVCDNIRINRSRIVTGEDYRGYIASKRRYFYGIRVHIMTTADGLPVEFSFLPGEAHDSRGLGVLPLILPQGSEIYADSAYTNYSVEDALQDEDEVTLSPIRKKDSTRYDEPLIRVYKKQMRQRIETTFSQIEGLFPKRIHAVTQQGFLIKLMVFIMAYTLDNAFV